MSLSKGIKKHELDFEILETNNTKRLVFLDTSIYYTNPTTPVLHLVKPGGEQVILNVSHGEINTFNSHSLGLTNPLTGDDTTAIPDGVWQAVYRICPYNELYTSKFFVRFEIINECLYNVYRNFDTECCGVENDQLKKCLNDIYLLMESAKANAYKNLKEKAEKDYSLAVKKINKIIKK